MKLKTMSLIAIFIAFTLSSCAQDNSPILVEYSDITMGADQIVAYKELLKNKKVGIVANQSSTIQNTHLVDSLLSHNIQITKIYCPEHGFRGTADAGSLIEDGLDSKTGIPIISLYGSHKKPTPEDLEGIDIVVFDLQDVGTRFYTYISTMSYVMEACAENGIPIIILDRPNPNGHYVDGPILEKENTSFVGLHPVPIVYGMTIGEYALMVVGEKWINDAHKLQLNVIELKYYTHNKIVKLKVKPSPNLPNWQSIYLYPSLCFFEGTIMSVGRGTDYPFQIYGHPNYMLGSYVFTPKSKDGASKPKYNEQNCFGANLSGYAENYKHNDNKIELNWLIGSYEIMSRKGEFFNNYFEKLSGTKDLRQQIIDGSSEEEIRLSWQPGLDRFMKIRSKYLLYD